MAASLPNPPALALLPEPYEFLDLENNHSIRLSIDRAQLGMAVIHPKTVSQRHLRIYMQHNNLSAPPVAGTPISVPIPVLRVYGQRIDLSSPLKYWDISSKTLTADLLPRVMAGASLPLVIAITAHGEKPHKRYSVEG